MFNYDSFVEFASTLINRDLDWISGHNDFNAAEEKRIKKKEFEAECSTYMDKLKADVEKELEERKEKDKKEIKRLRKELDAQRFELKIREEALNERTKVAEELEKKLSEREANINEKVKESEKLSEHNKRLEKATERYIAERNLWEQAVKEKKKAPVNYEAEFKGIRENFIRMNNLISETRNTLMEARNAVCETFDDGVEELCRLYADMYLSGNPYEEQMADKLAEILIRRFGAEPFEPAPGSAYCGELHEKLDYKEIGDIIVLCRARGWMYKNKTLVRAIVETKKGDN